MLRVQDVSSQLSTPAVTLSSPLHIWSLWNHKPKQVPSFLSCCYGAFSQQQKSNHAGKRTLSSSLRTHIKSQTRWCTFAVSVLWSQGQITPQGMPATSGERQVQWALCLKQKPKGWTAPKAGLRVPQICKQMCTHMYMCSHWKPKLTKYHYRSLEQQLELELSLSLIKKSFLHMQIFQLRICSLR